MLVSRRSVRFPNAWTLRDMPPAIFYPLLHSLYILLFFHTDQRYHIHNLVTFIRTNLFQYLYRNGWQDIRCGSSSTRLDSTQHAALFKYVQTQLNLFTPFGLRTTRSPADKTTHGDLDVMIGSHANGPGFKYQFAGEASEYANLPVTDYGKWSGMASTAEHQWTEQELTDWIRDVARALGAVVWQKHRIGAIYAVPCRVIGNLASEAGLNEVSSPLL
jgi:hypothetical protein